MFEILPWIVGLAAVTFSLYRKDDSPFIVFLYLFLGCTFLYFCYASIFGGVIVTDFLSILPFHLALLAFLSIAYIVKRYIKYDTIREIGNNPFFFILTGIHAFSFAFGATFLEYHWVQYLTSGMAVLFLISLFLANRFPKLFVAEATTFALVIASFTAYYILLKTLYPEITAESITQVVSAHNSFLMWPLLFLLYTFSVHNIVTVKTWGKLASVILTLFALGFSTHHPDLNKLASPIIKNVLDIAVLTGDGGTIAFSVAAVVKNRLATIV